MTWLVRNSRLLFFILAILLALPVPSSFMGGLMWFSPLMMLVHLLSAKAFVLLNLFGLAALVLIFLRKRIICHLFCPLGLVCDQVSGKAIRRNKLKVRPGFQKALALFTLGFALFGLPVFVILDPFFIFQVSFEPVRTGFNLAGAIKVIPLLSVIGINLFYPGSWCAKLCPLGGLQLLAYDLRKSIPEKKAASPGEGRRMFIWSLAGISLGLLTRPIRKNRADSRIRPPSALAGEDYALTCIRCGNCISACPTGIIYQRTDAGIMEILTPALDFSESYCLPECKRCGDVCPSGALARFSLDDKKALVMATAEVDPANCLLTHQKECRQCQLNCSYDAIVYRVPESALTPVPVVDPERCVGCAACKIVCPVDAIRITRAGVPSVKSAGRV